MIKDMIILLIAGLIKKILYANFLKPKPLGGNGKVELDCLIMRQKQI